MSTDVRITINDGCDLFQIRQVTDRLCIQEIDEIIGNELIKWNLDNDRLSNQSSRCEARVGISRNRTCEKSSGFRLFETPACGAGKSPKKK